MRLVSDWIGIRCVVRSRGSGVWLGELVDAEGTSVRLKMARRAWNWIGAASCSELAEKGPTGGKIAIPVEVVIHDVLEVLPAQIEALRRWDSIPVWQA